MKKEFQCPKCKKEIEYAEFSADVKQFGSVEIDSGQHHTRNYGNWHNIVYYCPFCEEDITEKVEEKL
ncbi:hypothetical protein KY314_01720 [Candidatus Woesearchaeota archaeon]|nr:hypothetical protein [Candidatus Woesearchaeota archaeon]